MADASVKIELFSQPRWNVPWLWAGRSEPATLVLAFDGVPPLAVPLAAWDGAAPRFATPAPTRDVQSAPVTLDEIERLTTSASVAVELMTVDGQREPC